ncbi:MAG: hypothetical protein AAGJ83_09845 [Planctomycetota bacterium]
MPSPSVLLITATQAVGFSPGGKSGRVTVLPADASGDIGLSIEALLATMPGRQRHVYVVTTEVWSQAVPIENRSLRRIEKSQVSQMLAFEAESFSGIAASSARTSSEVMESGPVETSFWVSQIDATRFAQAADAVAYNGGKLLGLTHPCGLPHAIRGNGSDWTRLEIWDDFGLIVSKRGRGPETRRFLPDAPPVPGTTAEARQIIEANGIQSQAFVEVLDATNASFDEITSAGSLTTDEAELPGSYGIEDAESIAAATSLASDQDIASLSDSGDLQAFLSGWSKTLKRNRSVPVIRPVRQGASPETRRQVALGAAAAAIVITAVHYNYGRVRDAAQVKDLQQQIEERQVPINQFATKEKELRDLEQSLVDTTEKLGNLEIQAARYRGQLGIHRSRMAQVLRTLGEERPAELILSGVESDDGAMRIVGRSLRPELIIRFAQAIAPRLESLNLSISVPRREALLLTAEGGPYEFEYLITDGV